MSTFYRTESYQINISIGHDVGDSGLIVVSSHTGPYNPKDPKLKCEAAVLIDGGEGDPWRAGGRALYFLKNIIKKRYDSDGIFLSAIVVTHFDTDHVQGITSLLQNLKKAGHDPLIDALFRNPPVRIYDTGVRTKKPRDSGKQLTNVFNVYLDAIAAAGTAVSRQNQGQRSISNKSPPVPGDISYHLGKEIFWGPDNNNLIGPAGADNQNIIDNIGMLRTWNNNHPGSRSGIPTWAPALYCIAKSNQALQTALPGGIDNLDASSFITANSITLTWDAATSAIWYEIQYAPSTGGRWQSLTTTDITIVVSGLKADTNYSFEVTAYNPVGSGNTAVIQETTSDTAETDYTYDGSQEVKSSTKANFRGVNQVQIVPSSNQTDTTNPNYDSIVLLLTSPGGDPIHYTGGDAFEDVDGKAVYWLSQVVANPADTMLSCKLSHHGSVGSTSIAKGQSLLDIMRPIAVTISNGSRFGHPSWETLYYVHMWQEIQSKQGSIDVIGTNYPNYLTSTSLLDDYYNRTRRAGLVKALTGIGWSTDSDALKFITPGSAKSNAQMLKFMTDEVLESWLPSNKYLTLSSGSSDDYVTCAALYYTSETNWREVEPSCLFKIAKSQFITSTVVPMTPLPDKIRGDDVMIVFNGGTITIEVSPPAGSDNLLYLFVSGLPGRHLQINGTPNTGSGWQLSGPIDIDSGIGQWLNQLNTDFKITTATFSINGSLTNQGTLITNASGVSCSLTLYINSSSFTFGSSSFSGSTDDTSLTMFNLSLTSDPSISVTDLFSAMTDIDIRVVDPIIPSSTKCQIDPSSTVLRWGYTTFPLISLDLSLVIQADNSSATIGPVTLSLSNSQLVFSRHDRLSQPSDSQYASRKSTGFAATAELSLTTQSGVAIDSTGTLDFDSSGALTLGLQEAKNVTAQDLVSTFLGSGGWITDPNGVASITSGTTSFGCRIRCSISTGISIDSIELTGSVSFADFGSCVITASVLYPGFVFQGTITSGISTLSSLYNNVGAQLTPDPISSTTTGMVSFYADPQNHAYSITAELASITLGDIVIDDLIVVYTRQSPNNALQLKATLSLSDPDSPGETMVTFLADYAGGQWILDGSSLGLSVYNLSYILSPDLQSELQSCIPDVVFTTLNFTLDLNNVILNIDATVTLDNTPLLFNYSYTKQTGADSGTNELTINIGDTVPTTLNLGQMLLDLGFSEGADLLGLQVPIPMIKIEYDFTNHAFVFTANSDDNNGNGVPSLELSVIRFISSDVSDPAPTTLVRLVFSPSPLTGVPLLGSVSFPVDDVFIAYASFPITSTDFQLLSTIDPDDVSLMALTINYINSPMPQGLQACIVYQSKLYSYQFTTNRTSSSSFLRSGYGSDLAPSATGATWLDYQKNLGPLQISRVGLNYIDGYLQLLVAGTVQLGPLTLDLQGFGIGIPTKPLTTEITDYQIVLDGLGVSFSDGPLTIGGSFTSQGACSLNGINYKHLYQGGVTVSAGGYTLVASGACGVEDNDVVTFFIFGRLNASLGGTPFAFITGVAGGFGYNQTLMAPTIDQVSTYPLIEGAIDPNALGGSDPLKVLSGLLGVNPPIIQVSLGSKDMWLALGVDFTSFEMINTRVLLTLNLGSTAEITLLGRSVVALPRGGSDSAETFLYAELDLDSTLDPDQGIFYARLAITSNSFVFSPDCHLTGGFALFNWFGKSPYRGDFVFSIGGYHPSFIVPSYYPTVPRLGFNWIIDSNTTASGQAYFAIVPNYAMGGGSLSFNYSDGALSAWFNAEANGLIEWEPFHYHIEIGVDVGASITLGWGFLSKTFTISLGADLVVWGPPIGGTAEVDWWVHSFTVKFGDDEVVSSGNVTWDSFKTALPQQSAVGMAFQKALRLQKRTAARLELITDEWEDLGDDGDDKDSENGASDVQYINIKSDQGLFPDSKVNLQDNGQPWIVQLSQWQFRIESPIPLTSARYTDSSGTVQCITIPSSQRENVNFRSLNVSQNSSPAPTVDLLVTFETSGLTWQAIPDPLVRTLPAGLVSAKVPPAIWGTTNTSSANLAALDVVSGLCFKPPAPPTSSSSGPIPYGNILVPEVLGNIPFAVLSGDFSYAQNSDVIELITNTIANSNVQTQRQNLAAILSGAGMGSFQSGALDTYKSMISTIYVDVIKPMFIAYTS